MSSGTRAVFLDKDGTLIDNVPYNVDPSRVAFSRGALDGLRLLQRHGYALIVVSNQPGIAKGYFDEHAFVRHREHLTEALAAHGIMLTDFYHCPHHPEGTVSGYAMACNCRKPMSGMLMRAVERHGIEPGRSWMIGDILHDVEAGRRAGCRTILIDNGNETEWQWSLLRSPDMIFSDLLAAARAAVLADFHIQPEMREALPS